MGNVPAVARSAVVSCAVNCRELTSVVLRSPPLKRTMELLLKFVPFTVSANAASPSCLLAGESVLRVGTGLLTVRLTALAVPPPGAGLKTVIGKRPAA